MNCPQGHAALHFSLPHPMRAEGMDVYQCLTCVRQEVNGTWQRMAGYCAGCDTPTWRRLTHPVSGHRVLLWPKPDTIFAYLQALDWPGVDSVWQDYCPACCPEVGALPARAVVEENGIPRASGACIGHRTAHDKYAFHFSDRYGAWLATHLVDGYGVSEGEARALLDQWARDRVAGAAVAV